MPIGVLAVAAVVVFAFFMYSATRRRVEAELASARLRARRGASRRARGDDAMGPVAACGRSCSPDSSRIVVYVNAFAPILPVPAAPRSCRARAWLGWISRAPWIAIYAPRRSISPYRTWIAADRYQEASELAFHLPDHPETFALNLTSRPNNYDLWPSFPRARASTGRAHPRRGRRRRRAPDRIAARAAFHDAHDGASSFRLARNGDQTKHLRIWVLDGWRGTWPQPELRSR